MSRRRARWMVLMGAVLIRTTLADDGCTGPSSDCVAVGSWNFSVSMGAGVRTNPLVHGQDMPLVIVPQFSYYGKHLFVQNLDAGLTLLDGGHNTFSVVASPGYDRIFFYQSDLQNIFVGGLGNPPSEVALYSQSFASRPRKITYLAGPEWTFKYARISGQADLLHEVTGRNGGEEIRAALGIPLIESAGTLSASLGFTWKSEAIVNYYYGAPKVYQAGGAFNPFVKFGYSQPIAGRWKLTALVHFECLGKAIADSPIVAKRTVTTLFAGATYEF